MKKSIVFVLIFFTIVSTSYSQELTPEQRQQQHEQRSDSVLSARTVQEVKKQITITAQQETALRQAAVQSNQAKRSAFKQYRKTEFFLREMAKAEHLQDSLYEAVLGAKQYRLYREKRNIEQEKRIAALRQKAEQSKDSLKIKPVQP